MVTRKKMAAMMLGSMLGVGSMAMADTVGLNLVGGGGPGGGTLTSGETAGAGAYAQSNWNNLNTDWSGDASNDALFAAGFTTNTGSTVQFGRISYSPHLDPAHYDAIGVWGTGIAAGTADQRLMRGYLDSNATTSQPYLNLRPQYAQYSVVLYVDGDQNSGAVNGGYYLQSWVNDPFGSSTNITSKVYAREGTAGQNHFAGTYQQVPLTSTTVGGAATGNYIVFEGITAANLRIRAEQETGTRAPLNAVQIIDTDPYQGFGVNFVGGRGGTSNTDGVADGLAGAGGAYIQGFWNNSAGNSTASGTFAAGTVLDRHGHAISGMTVTYSAPNTYTADTVGVAAHDANDKLMKGYLDSNGSNGPTITVSGVTSRQYDVVVYVDGDQGIGGNNGQYWLEDLSGNVLSNKSYIKEGTNASGSFNGVYAEGRSSAAGTGLADTANYLVFSGVTAGSFVLKGRESGSRAPINAFQVLQTDTRAIGVRFQGNATSAMLTQEIAGVVSQSHWNNAPGASGGPTSLVDSFGDASGATVQWSAPNTWSVNSGATPGDNRLLAGYLDNFHEAGRFITVSNINFAEYDVYVYGDSDRPNGNQSTYILNGVLTEVMTEGTFDGILTEGRDYVVFRGVTGSSFTLTADQLVNIGQGAAAPISAIQIVAHVPAPAALPAGLGLMSLLTMRRRKPRLA